ncbi:TPA: phage regulatory CII family protein [Vibrio parahaemolyticus]|nr:Phage regulatory protein like CII [Vibrio parahaemolyticus BB22OP]MQF42692.1 transcriptional regulator [Vibrio parahaemolyticus]TOZ80088.1 transcriptional regulator [Vibrio parahaemolyticus]TOZ99809.1 transcriptional regulator [Vibrio parahaemolyticus]HCE1985939.1 phage regulatory CII family protein [Vibrio parahaemolyticus]
MCVFCESKQAAFDEACCSFTERHNIQKIAKAIGLTPTMLRNKLNPAQPHVLKPVELMAVSKVSNDYALLNCLLNGLDIVTAPVNSAEEAESVIERLMKHTANAGDISHWALKNSGSRSLSRTEKQSLVHLAQTGIGNLVLLINDIENRTSGASPLLGMGLDFIANGGVVPGLA